MEATTKRRRRRRGNKSALIREYFDSHPAAGPSEVVAALAEKKVRVTPTLVSNVKSRMQHGGSTAGKRRRGRPGRPGRRPAGEAALTVSVLVEAKRLAESAGSLDAARQALDALSKLQ